MRAVSSISAPDPFGPAGTARHCAIAQPEAAPDLGRGRALRGRSLRSRALRRDPFGGRSRRMALVDLGDDRGGGLGTDRVPGDPLVSLDTALELLDDAVLGDGDDRRGAGL